MRKGLLLAAIHTLLALGTAGKYLYDRASLPRVWARTAPYDPDMPIRGRYVRMTLEVAPVNLTELYGSAVLSVANGKLTATSAPDGEPVMRRDDTKRYLLNMPLAYFLPEHVPDPSVRAQGEELWAEVSVPPKGPPRPVRLGVKRGDGPIVPLP